MLDTRHSANDQWSPSIRHSWSIRLLLAALLGFASEVLLWTSPTTRPIFDWGLLALGYLALSSLLLELAARFRLRDVFGLLALAGIYGMLNGLILNPDSALIDVPRTLITRAMGAHAATGLIALALFLLLTRGGLRSRMTAIAALGLTLIVGVGWGAWARWSPVEFAGLDASTPESLALVACISMALIALTLAAARRVSAPVDLRLDARGWAFTLIVLIGLLVIHLAQGAIDPLSLAIIVTLTIFSIMICWFQQRKKGMTLLDPVGSEPPSWAPVLLLIIVFAAAGVVGFSLPRGELSRDPLALIGALFTAYGLIWLPAVSIVLGARAFSRQARAMRL